VEEGEEEEEEGEEDEEEEEEKEEEDESRPGLILNPELMRYLVFIPLIYMRVFVFLQFICEDST